MSWIDKLEQRVGLRPAPEPVEHVVVFKSAITSTDISNIMSHLGVS